MVNTSQQSRQNLLFILLRRTLLMLNAQCSFLHFIPTLSEILSEQILKQSAMIRLSAPMVKHMELIETGV